MYIYINKRWCKYAVIPQCFVHRPRYSNSRNHFHRPNSIQRHFLLFITLLFFFFLFYRVYRDSILRDTNFIFASFLLLFLETLNKCDITIANIQNLREPIYGFHYTTIYNNIYLCIYIYFLVYLNTIYNTLYNNICVYIVRNIVSMDRAPRLKLT